MNPFLTDLKSSFQASSSLESHNPLILPATPILRDEIETLREASEIAGDASATDELKEAAQIEVSLSGAIEQVNAVQGTSPALIEPVVAVVNDTLADTAKRLDVGDAPQLVLDETTYQITDDSMEGVMDWLKRALAAFQSALRQTGARLRMGFNRFVNVSTALQRRISQCYSLMGRRKQPAGGNPIKVKKNYLTHLVLGDALAVNPVQNLTELAEAVAVIVQSYLTYFDTVSTQLKGRLVESLGVGAGVSNTPLNVDIGQLVDTLNTVVKKDTLFLKNTKLRLTTGGGAVSNVDLQEVSPRADYIVNNLQGVHSVSNEAAKTILIDVSRLVDENTKFLEQTLDKLERDISNMVTAIDAIRPAEGQTPLVSERDLATVSNRVTQDLSQVYNTIYYLWDAQVSRIGAVIALVEESFMQD